MKPPLLLSVALAASLCGSPILVGLPAANAAAGPPFGAIWIADTSADSVSAYAAGASGSATPIATIVGGTTGLSAPTGVAVSTNGAVYVANSGNDSITEYAPGATGDTAPTATIEGATTGLDAPSSLTMAGDELWVTDPATNVVEAFTAGSDGNVLPAESISGPKTGLNHPIALAVDNSLDGLGALLGLVGVYVVNRPTTGPATVTGYLAGQFGNHAPVAKITGSLAHPVTSPTAILSAGFGTIWLADTATNTISQYFTFPGIPQSGPTLTIKGSKTGLDAPTTLGINAFNDLVVGNAGSHTLSVFGPAAQGNTAPLRTVSNVGASDPGTPASVSVYGTAPGRPTAVKVKLHRRASATGSSMTVTWKAPAVTGGGVIGYDLEVDGIVYGQDGVSISGEDPIGVLVGNIGITTRGTTFTARHLKLGRTYDVVVVAVNAFGTSELAKSARIPLTTPPGPPQDVSAKARHQSIVVSWQAPKADGGHPVKRYRVEYATCPPGSKGCATHSRVVSQALHEVTIGALAAGTTYDVRVAAVSKDGVGPPSAIVKVATRG